MNKGYLICKKVYDELETTTVDRTKTICFKESRGDEMVTAVKCPLTGDFIELSDLRKVYFC